MPTWNKRYAATKEKVSHFEVKWQPPLTNVLNKSKRFGGILAFQTELLNWLTKKILKIVVFYLVNE